MTLEGILTILVLALALTAIFYAWHMTGTLILKSVIVLVALIVVFGTVVLSGAV